MSSFVCFIHPSMIDLLRAERGGDAVDAKLRSGEMIEVREVLEFRPAIDPAPPMLLARPAGNGKPWYAKFDKRPRK